MSSRGKPFKKGKSGNPGGRPKGARNKATMMAEALFDGEAEKLARKAVNLALKGDTTALRLCIERVLPTRKDRPVEFALPDTGTPTGLVEGMAAILDAVASSDLTPSEGQALAALIESQRRAIETDHLEGRVAALEKQGARP